MTRESFRPVGTNLLCRRASNREQKKANLVVPASQGSGRASRRQEMPRVLELIVVAAGNAEGKAKEEKEIMAAFKPGDRIAVANSPVSVVFLNGDEHIIVDAQFVEGVIQEADHDPGASETA